MEKEKEKNNSGLITLVIVLFLLVLGLGGYIVYDKVLSDNSAKQTREDAQTTTVDNNISEESATNESTTDANQTAPSNNNEQKATIKYFYDVKDLKVKALPEYQVFANISKNRNVVETLDFGFEKDYRATLDLAGNVMVQKFSKGENEKGITGNLNVTSVIDILQFDVPSVEVDQLLYLLTDNGNLYYYRIGDIEKNSFTATKVESVSNVKKIFISNYSKENAGGSWALFAITEGNDCIMIKGESV